MVLGGKECRTKCWKIDVRYGKMLELPVSAVNFVQYIWFHNICVKFCFARISFVK